jgi:hypothetical protein
MEEDGIFCVLLWDAKLDEGVNAIASCAVARSNEKERALESFIVSLELVCDE